jgi:hypothetical protein
MTSKPYFRGGGDWSAGGGLTALRAKIAERVALGPYSKRVSIGLRRDLSVAVDPPSAKIPVRLRDFRPDDLRELFPAGGDAAAQGERADVEWRLRAVAYGTLPSHCYVLVDESSGRPCHIQWLTEPGYGDAIRRSCALPTLADGEAMLENAFTPAGFHGLGVMTAAVHLIAAHAGASGKRQLLAFVDADNFASLKAVERAGFTRWSVRTRQQFGFGIVRTVRFEPISTAAGAAALPLPHATGRQACPGEGVPLPEDARRSGPD